MWFLLRVCLICCWHSNFGFVYLIWKLPGKRKKRVNCLPLHVVWTSDPILVSKHIPCYSSTDTCGYIIPWQAVVMLGSWLHDKDWGTNKKSILLKWNVLMLMFSSAWKSLPPENHQTNPVVPEALRSPECSGRVRNVARIHFAKSFMISIYLLNWTAGIGLWFSWL